jgi:hypothetical protein
LSIANPEDRYQIHPASAKIPKAQAMPWTEQLASSNELRRFIRDLVALSTLPTAWRNYDMRRPMDGRA